MRFSYIALFALPALVTASAVMPRNGGGGGKPKCSSGTNYCCNTTEQANAIDPVTAATLALLGVDVGSLTGLVGLGCVDVVSIGGTCNNQNVCCKNVKGSALIGIYCSPITV